MRAKMHKKHQKKTLFSTFYKSEGFPNKSCVAARGEKYLCHIYWVWQQEGCVSRIGNVTFSGFSDMYDICDM